MKWIDIDERLPKTGKYIVKTERPHPMMPKHKLTARMESSVTIHKDPDTFQPYASWEVRNQRVTHWLEE